MFIIGRGLQIKSKGGPIAQAPTIALSNGNKMPVLGFGVFQMSDEEAEESVVTALKTGYRSIDTPASYNNEEAVGRGIKQSGVPRTKYL